MEAASLRYALHRHWIAAWVTFGLVAAATLLAAFVPQQRYEATVVVSVQPAQEGVSTSLLTYLIPSLEARARGASLAADVDTALPPDLRGSEWVVRTNVSPGSGVMGITVNSAQQQVPVAAANAYGQILANEDLGTDMLQVLVIDPASEARSTSSRMMVLLSGLALGLILAPLVALLRAGWSSRPVERHGRRALPASQRQDDRIEVTEPQPYGAR